MTDFVPVRAESTGLEQTVPAHWLDHPVLGADFAIVNDQFAPTGPTDPEPAAPTDHFEEA